MTIRCNLDETDYRAFRRHVMFRYRKIHWLYGAVVTLLLCLTWIGSKPEERIFALVSFVVTFGGIALVVQLVLRIISRFTGTRFQGAMGEHVFEFTEDGLTETNDNGKTETRASAIRRIDETPRHFFVITNAGLGYVIPKRYLENADELRIWQSKITMRAP